MIQLTRFDTCVYVFDVNKLRGQVVECSTAHGIDATHNNRSLRTLRLPGRTYARDLGSAIDETARDLFVYDEEG